MGTNPAPDERLLVNYNRTGVAVMEAMYSADYLSVGGVASTDELGRLAGVSERSQILDIGCGVGGPMLHLASTVGCTVTGLDLVESSVEQARRRAGERGLDHLATFHQGDATDLPYGEDCFDIVWGQDAWCHVPDKAALLSEAARVLRPDGTLAFTDWLAGDGLSSVERSAALAAALSETAASSQLYTELLGEAGFVDVSYRDIAQQLTDRYREICAGLEAHQKELKDRFGERVYAIVAATNGTILRGFEGGAIGGGLFIAKCPVAAQPR